MSHILSERDAALLSDYLDGQLSPAESRRLEERFKADAGFAAMAQDMRQARNVLRHLPARRAPKNFMLTAKMAGVKPPLPRLFPVFRFASALAAVLFLFTFGLNFSVPFAASMRASAPAQSFAVEDAGLCAGCTSELPAAQAPAAGGNAMPTGTAEVSTFLAQPNEQDMQSAPTLAVEQPAPQQKSAPPGVVDAGALPGAGLSLPAVLQLGLLFVAVLSGAAALLVRRRFEQAWYRARSMQYQKESRLQVLAWVFALLVAAGFAAAVLALSGVLRW